MHKYLYKTRLDIFMEEEFFKIPEDKITDFITAGDETTDMWIMHFKGIFNGFQTKFKVPFMITEDRPGGLKTIWKEKVG